MNRLLFDPGGLRCNLFTLRSYQKGVNSPHVLTSLFKLWLRELEEPIVPEESYSEALKASRDPVESCMFVRNLPTVERRVCIFVIGFLQ